MARTDPGALSAVGVARQRRVVHRGPVRDQVNVAAGWIIRRSQPGQSDEGGLLAGGQYTNLSVRQ
jgi:hypothetical protein